MDMKDILEKAAELSASDVILTRGSTPVYRVHGKLIEMDGPPLSSERLKQILFGLLSQDQIAHLERQKELDFSFNVVGKGEGGRTLRFRGNCFYQRYSIGAVFRLIPTKIPTLEELGLPIILGQLALSRQGLVLMTGPTGSGKSTTLAAMIDIINRNRKAHIVTIEDPIEYVHRNRHSVIEQREVGEDTLSFPTALRHVLRQDPDVILIGEMRDLETISAALTAAETGHLVLATLHTNDCIQSIDRIIDSYPSHQQSQVRSQLSLCLAAIANQRLIPTFDGKGRVAALELLINTLPVANLIREKKLHQIYGVMETSSKDGMITMDKAVKDLYLRGKVSITEARSRMRNPTLLEVERGKLLHERYPRGIKR
jgi:twitching motility protein PilT